MRVAFNARILRGGAGGPRAGVHRYVQRLLAELPLVLDAGERLDVLGTPGGTGEAGERAWRRIAWEQAALPAVAARRRATLIHGPVNAVPLVAPCPTVVTVHDLAFRLHPETVPAGRRRYLAAVVGASVRRAAVVLAVSEATKADVVRAFAIDPGKIHVTPLGVDGHFRPVDTGASRRFRADRVITRPYIVAVGTLEPRKNLPVLIDAFALIASRIPHDLVLVGGRGWLGESLDARLARLPAPLRARIRLAGHVSDADLPLWYGAADLFAFPSRMEGFGLPVLEAMACGTPVVCSNASALTEVAADAALTVGPDDIDALASAMLSILDDAELARSLRARGIARAATFTWRRTAETTVTAYRAAQRR